MWRTHCSGAKTKPVYLKSAFKFPAPLLFSFSREENLSDMGGWMGGWVGRPGMARAPNDPLSPWRVTEQ